MGTPLEMLYDYLNKLKSDRKPRSVRDKEPAVSQKEKATRLFEYFLGMVLAFPETFFKLWKEWADYDAFYKRVSQSELVKPFHRLDREKFTAFYEQFPAGFDSSEKSVYKQISDHYNTAGTVDESFYLDVSEGQKLKTLAFEAEVKNPDLKLIEKEFEKLIALLYLELHGKN